MSDTGGKGGRGEEGGSRRPDHHERVLRRLRWSPRRTIPYVQQTAQADCGAACLAMVLAYHGKHVPLERVRQAAGVDRNGADAFHLLQAARWFGLRARGVRVDRVEDLRHLPPGTVLHWRFRHYVVLDRVRRNGRVEVVDPALGRRGIGEEEMSRSFTGVALVLEPTEALDPSPPERGSLWRYLRRVLQESASLRRIVTVSLVLQLLALSIPLATGVLVDRVIPRGDVHLFTVLAIGLAMIAGFQLLCALLRSYLVLHLRTRLDADLTLEFLDHMLGLPYSFFEQRSAGDLIMRVDSNTFIREVLTSSSLSAILDGSLASLSMLFLVAIDARLALVVLGLAALRLAVFTVTRRRHRDLMAEVIQRRAVARGYQVQMMAGIETVKASGAEDRVVEHWASRFVDELNGLLDQGRLEAKTQSVLEVLATASPLILLLAGTRLVLAGDLALGTMLAGVALGVGFLQPLSTMVTKAFDLQRLGAYLDRIDDVLRTEREGSDRTSSRRSEPSGRIEVEEVSFRYGPLAPRVLRDVSFSIEPGRMVAIVGPTGSGKSTLASLLFGLHRPGEGRILYDGVDLSSWDLRWLRGRLGVVTQHPYLFGASIRDNIALTEPEASIDRVIEAARAAAIHDDVASLPMGYDTTLADGGASLSGGQRQRLALARALLNRPALLFLDEATSALDTVAERRVQEALEAMQITRVVIAHRMSTVRRADCILVLDQGRLVATGTHGELLAGCPLYAELAGDPDTPRPGDEEGFGRTVAEG